MNFRRFLATLICFSFVLMIGLINEVQAAEEKISASDYKLLQDLGNAKANKKVIKFQERTAHEDYERKIISYKDFAQQRFGFAQQRRRFDEQEDRARLGLIQSGFLPGPENREVKSQLAAFSQEQLTEKHYALERENKDIDLKIQTLENQLILQQINEASFIAQASELETQKEINKNYLRDCRTALESKGFTPKGKPRPR